MADQGLVSFFLKLLCTCAANRQQITRIQVYLFMAFNFIKFLKNRSLEMNPAERSSAKDLKTLMDVNL